MSEAYAKVHLRDYVRADDIDFAIKMLLESFLQSQKTSIQRVLRKKFDRYLGSTSDANQALHFILNKIAHQKALLFKYNRGIEEVETVHVEVKVTDF